jgi:hypothetical protein
MHGMHGEVCVDIYPFLCEGHSQTKVRESGVS